MSKLSLIDQIIEAIDQGNEIPEGWEQTANPGELKQIQALLSVHRITKKIKQKQQNAAMHQFNSGDQWMHLIIQEKIGSGGFGQVCKAYDSVLQTDVAVKFLNKNLVEIDDASFLHEARLMATVRNPHVLAIHGAAKDKGVSGYWSDYLDGEILYESLQKRSFDIQEKITIINEITQAVKATHDNGVVHGDIKSMNVMLQPNRGAILLDFGSGRNKSPSDNQQLTVQASPIAMAPEQYSGQNNSQATDVFSLGLLMVEILVGKHPFTDLSLIQIIQSANNISGNLSALNLPRSWKKLLRTMLAVDANQRPDMQFVLNSIQKIEEKPLRLAKRMTLLTTITLLMGVTASSLYSNFNIKRANQQTEVINAILYDNFLTIAPHKEGKSVTLVQVMDSVGGKVLENKELTKENQEKLLVRMVGTYLTLSDLQHVVSLGQRVLALPKLDPLNRMKVMRYVGLAHSHLREFELAEFYFKGILNLTASTVEEYDEQLKTINPLVFGYLNHNQYDQVPAMLEKLDDLRPFGSNRPIMMGAAEHTKALYYSNTNNPIAANQAYINAAEFYTTHYHADHYSVLDAYSQAASQFIKSADLILKQKGVDQIIGLLPQMEQVMGKTHNNYLIAQINLANGYCDLGRAEDAINLLKNIQQVVYDKLGRQNLLSLLLYDRALAHSYANNQQLTEAESIYLQTIDLLIEYHPDDLLTRIEAVMNLLDFYLLNQQLGQAQSLGQEYAIIAEQQLIVSDRMNLQLKAMNARVNIAAGVEGATQQLADVFQLYVKYLGQNDHLTLGLKQIIEELN